MERKRNYIETVRDWADERAVILVMSALFGGLSLYITISSIYNIGKRDGQRLQIEHIRQFPLHGNDSINLTNRPEYGRSTEK